MLALLVASLSIALVASGFSSAGGETAAGGGGASGEPIVIGIYTPADNPAFTAPELIDGAEAAIEYVNNDLDGLGGRPLELVSCTTEYTAPSLTACANELFEQDPLIIIPGPDASAFSVQPIFDESGIPLIGGASFTPPEYTSPSRVLFNGFSASLFPAMIHFAVDELDAQNIATMSIEDPTTTIIKQLFFDPVAANYGLPMPELVQVPTGTGDMTSFVAAALDTDPDVLLPFGLPCLPFFQAYQSLGSDVPVILPDNCADADTLEEAGDQADGAYFIELYNDTRITPKNKDVKLFVKQMNKYAKGAVDSSFSRSGFGTIMNIHALLDSTDPNTLTHESVIAAFKQTTDQPNFLNTPYSCTAPPVEQYPAICAGSAFLTRQVDGELERQSKFVTLDVLFNEQGA